MLQTNLANLTAQYQQAYLVYCYKVMQQLQLLAWLEQQNKVKKEAKKTTPKGEKCTSAKKNLELKQHQKKPNLRTNRHPGKPELVAKNAMPFTKDAFGKPRNGDWSDMGGLFEAKLDFADVDANGNTIGTIDITKRGFTDHEHLDEMQLIHMNGRQYDYNNGRFLNVDPFIQSPTSTQSLNPYTYIFNNPLSGVDPTGYYVCKPGRAGCDEPKPKPKKKRNRKKPGSGKGYGWVTVYQASSRNNGNSSNGNKGNEKGEVSSLESQNLIAQNDLSAQEKNRMFKCETLGSNYPGCSGSDFQNGLNDIKKGAGVVADELGNPVNYIGGGIYKAAGKAGVYLISVGGKLVPFTKLIGLSKGAKFAQKTFRNEFSDRGIVEFERITGVSGIRSVDQLSTAIVKGKVNPADIHINIINRNGTDLILNTRSAHALEGAGIPRSSFTVIDRTGDVKFEQMLTEQLKRNNLTSEGVSKVTKEY